MDNQEKNTIIMQDEDGNKIEVEILFSYEDESTEKVYVFLVDYTDNTIIIGELKDDNSINILGPETEDSLKDKLQAVYNDFVRQTYKDDEESQCGCGHHHHHHHHDGECCEGDCNCGEENNCCCDHHE